MPIYLAVLQMQFGIRMQRLAYIACTICILYSRIYILNNFLMFFFISKYECQNELFMYKMWGSKWLNYISKFFQCKLKNIIKPEDLLDSIVHTNMLGLTTVAIQVTKFQSKFIVSVLITFICRGAWTYCQIGRYIYGSIIELEFIQCRFKFRCRGYVSLVGLIYHRYKNL
jgi:hypothetical protein